MLTYCFCTENTVSDSKALSWNIMQYSILYAKGKTKKGKKEEEEERLTFCHRMWNKIAYKKMKKEKGKEKEKNQVPYLSWGIIVKSSFRNLGLWYCYNGSRIISIKAERKHIYFSFSHDCNILEYLTWKCIYL